MKDVKNSMRLEFPSRSCNEAFARTAVSAFASQLDPTLDELSDIKTAVSEAVTNCIVHAYADRIGTVYITARIIDDSVYVTVRDRGCGIGDIEKAMTPEFTTAPQGERSGLGFSIMQSFCDTLRVRSTVGRGTTVVMGKRISRRR